MVYRIGQQDMALSTSARTAPPHPRRPWVRRLTVAVLFVTGVPASSHAQQPPGPPASRPAIAPREAPPAGAAAPRIQPPFAAILDDSEEAAALLKRADEAIRREDWKLAIDSLQRIVEMPGDSVLRVDERTYESARRHAQRRIAALPAAGLAAYRLLHDGEAEVMYRRAIEAHDEGVLRELVDRFLLTTCGDLAANVLAGWWLDEGRAAAAVTLLRDLHDIYPNSRIPRGILDAKLALAMALAGRPRAAQAMADAWPAAGAAQGPLVARLELLRSTLGGLRPVSPEAPEVWPIVMGGPTRAGLMPPVEPTLLENSPWRAALPHETRGRLDELYAYQRETRALPVMQPVTDGRVIVVKCEGRLLALDAETFDPIWRAAPTALPSEEANRRRGGGFVQWAGVAAQPEAAALDRSRRAAALFLDYVDGSVTLSHGLALTPSRSPEALAYLSGILARRPEANLLVEDGGTIANQLLAYDLRTGRIRWRSGGEEAAGGAGVPSAEPGEKLTGPVEFLAPPVPVAEGLLVPYRSACDLYAAVLDPADGRLKRRVYLCGLGSGVLNSFAALHPCVADGIAYIPTGRGVLIALDTITWSIRWAVRYGADSGPAQHLAGAVPAARTAARATAQGGWLCSPPIATAGLVLLAPTDADTLYAFDCARGGVAWQVERGDSLYLLGADARHAWVVGPGVTQIDLETGRRTWRQEVGIPTGRGAISGDRLYLPTAEYVAVYEAETGRPTGRLDLPSGHAAFGNLLCWDGGLYTCDLGEVRRFPDMVRAYERAVAAHRKAPSEASSAIRLAWLEMLREQPGRALEALDGVRVEEVSADPRTARLVDHLAHLRVEALLMIAGAPAAASEETNRLLLQAKQTARRPADAVRAALALAERWNRAGRPMEAYREYAEIALAPASGPPTGGLVSSQASPGTPVGSPRATAPGDVMIDAAPGVRQPARLVIAERLRTIEKALSDSQRASLASWLEQKLDATVRAASAAEGDRRSAEISSGADPLEQLSYMADAGLLGDVGARAALQLGIRAERDERCEEAEYYYQEVVRRRRPAEAVAEALARLAQLHLGPEELNMPATASDEISRLEKEFAATEIPAEALRDGLVAARAADAQSLTSARISGAAAARRLRERIDKAALAGHREAMGTPRLGPPGKVAWITRHTGAAPLQLRGRRPESLAETMLLLSNWSEVRAHRVRDGKLLWPATLRLIDQAAPSVGLAPPLAPAGYEQTVLRPGAVYDGQVMVVNSATGLHAIGLATGLRLWSRPYRPAPESVTASNAFLAADAGELLSLDADGTLTMSRMIDGEAVRWQREMVNPPAGGWAAVRIGGGFAIAVNRALSHVSVFRRTDGRHLGAVSFAQPDGKERRKVSLVLFDEVVCGPAGPSEVAACELATPGVERWRLRCEQDGRPVAVTGLFKPRPDLLGVGCAAGAVMLVDPSNGKIVLSVKTGLPEADIFEGAITDDVLCLYAATGDEKEAFQIVAIDARDGHLLWHRSPEAGEYWSQLHYAHPLDNALLSAAANAIPVAQLIAPGAGPAGGRAARRTPLTEPQEPPEIRLRLTLLDKRTGREIGRPETVALPAAETMAMIHHVLTWPDRVIVVGDSTYVAFRIDPGIGDAAARDDHATTGTPTGEGS